MFSFNMLPTPLIPRTFVCQYFCYSVAMLPGNEREDVERGGKIIMPPSALDHLTRLNINYPMLFKLVNQTADRVTHCGVLEFVADERKVYLPHWMMRNLMLNEGDVIQIESVSLPVGNFSRFQPHSVDFLDISNPKAVLENCLRNFACLTEGDVINIKYNQKDYELFVLETKPGNAISIIECDMNVEFAPPLGYKEETTHETKEEEKEEEPLPYEGDFLGFLAFSGQGYRLDGKENKDGQKPSKPKTGDSVKGIPDYDWKVGTLTFLRNVPSLSGPDKKIEEGGDNQFTAFEGKGNVLKEDNK